MILWGFSALPMLIPAAAKCAGCDGRWIYPGRGQLPFPQTHVKGPGSARWVRCTSLQSSENSGQAAAQRTEQERAKRKLEKQARRISELDRIIQQLYEDRVASSAGSVYFFTIFRKFWTLTVWASASATTPRNSSADCFRSACSFSGDEAGKRQCHLETDEFNWYSGTVLSGGSVVAS